MKDKLANGSIRVTRNDALHSAVAMIPAFFIVMSGNIAGGAAFAIGILPTSKMGIAPKRKQRIIFGILGCLFGVSVFLGSHIIQLGVLPASVILFLIAFFSAVAASKKPAGALLLALIIPALGIGMGYGTDEVLNITLLFIVGSLWSAFVSLFFSEFESDPDAEAAQKAWQPTNPRFYGLMLGLAGVSALVFGSAFDPDNLGWIMAATLLIMRPLSQMTGVRGISRAIVTIIGSVFAVVVLKIDPILFILALLIISASILQIGTRKSDWYLSPGATAFLILLLQLYDSSDLALARQTAWSRISDNILAACIALFFGLLIPTIISKYRKTKFVSNA